MTTRPSLWQDIALDLRQGIGAGQYPPGAKLPSEAQLAARYGVNRHTVRRALAALREEGLLRARRGAGVFVRVQPAEYPIRKRVRFRETMTAAGRLAEKRVISRETRSADARESAALKLDAGAPVHVVDGLSLSDGEPAALWRSVFPAERFPDLPGFLERNGSVTAAFAACGVSDYTRATTRVSAELADPVQAGHLLISPGDAILRTVAVNVDAEDAPVEYGRTWFAGDRITLLIEGERAP